MSPQSNFGNSNNATEDESIGSSDFEDEINLVCCDVLQPFTRLILDELVSTFFYDYICPTRQIPVFEPTREAKSSFQGTREGEDRDITINSDLNQGDYGKRKRQDSEDRNSGDEKDGDEGRAPTKKLIPRPSPNTRPTFWACPFSKWKPLSYRKCCQYILKDVSRVKQHLRRYHERPSYCPICWKTFQDEEMFESHIQNRNCSPQPKRDVDGVTSVQQKKLERRSEKQLSKPEQWYAIYEILFPGQPHPESPYIDSGLSAELLSFEAFMETEGLAIVERKAREYVPSILVPHREEILAFSQVLFQQSIPDILRMYDIARLRNNDPDSGYRTVSEIGTGRNAEDERTGVSTKALLHKWCRISNCQ